MTNTNEMELELRGSTASTGICIGKAYLVGREGVDVVDKYFISEDNLQNEIKRFKAEVKSDKENTSENIEPTPYEWREHLHILRYGMGHDVR